ncbi:hypothetical protein QUA36_20850 [Microcoleus sp. Pol10D4]
MATTNSTKPISAPVSPPVRLADLTREEANTLTEQIKENFDSLGNMLIAARDRKAYKALGYRSFESYCQSEFGKSSSTAYQAIEDAKVRSQLEARISENYGEEVTLKFPSSHLRSLKAVEDIDDKLRAIEYAQKLAEGEGKKPTKQHLEIAVFEISGKRSEDFRSAIQKLGFIKGVQVETISPIKKDRGIITNLDKAGLIYVEHYYGSNKSVPYRPTELRILTDKEKPANPLEGSVAAKGDRVLIYAEGLQGKKGNIYSWKEGKTALVKIDGREKDSPVNIAYAEMELLKEIEPKNATWDSDLIWNSGKNTYYYFPQEKRITSNLWPLGLYLEPSTLDTASGSPINLMHQWERDVAGKVLESLANPARTKTLALAQAIDLPEEEGKEFATDLIASLLQLFPGAAPSPITQKALGISFSKTITELKSGKKTQTRRAWQDDYAKSFIRYFEEGIAIPALDKGRHRGGSELGFIKLTQRPYQQYLSEISPADLQEEGGMVATAQEFIDTFFDGQDKLVWVLHFEFRLTPVNQDTEEAIAENHRLREQLAEAETVIQQMIAASEPSVLASLELVENSPETSTPGETAAHPDFLAENISETSTPGETVAHPDFLLEKTLPPGMEAQVGLLVSIYGYPETVYEIIKIGRVQHLCKDIKTGLTEWIDKTPLRIKVDQPMVAEFLSHAENPTPADTAAHSDFSLENSPEIASPGETADEWKSILISNNFSRNYHYTDDCTEKYRGWTIYLDPNGGYSYIGLNHPEKGAYCCDTHFLGFKLEEENEIIKWAKGIINQVEDFCPGQLALDLDLDIETNTELPQLPLAIQPVKPPQQDINAAIATKRANIKEELEQLTQELLQTKNEKKTNKIRANIRQLEARLEDVDKFEISRIGDSVIRSKFPDKKGIIERLEVSATGLPTAWVIWPQEYEGEPNSPEEHNIGTLTNLSSASRGEK